MSHHFDTPTGRDDPRLNLCDFYLFEGAAGRTVMAMTVNPEAVPGVRRRSTMRVFTPSASTPAATGVRTCL